jgi:hypothetical protein
MAAVRLRETGAQTRISLNITDHCWPEGVGGELSRIVRAVDQSGLDTV